MRIEPVELPEFGLSVSWAMCRNAMCANFGIPFEGVNLFENWGADKKARPYPR